LRFHSFSFKYPSLVEAKKAHHRIVAINMPGFKGILSHFTQPGKMFADELSERLKVIACLERPNMTHSEELEPLISKEDLEKVKIMLGADPNDAQLILWGPEDDMKTAIETIDERCKMAFIGVPNETRKSFEDGTTIFERVLPGADRMYPDTDSAPIPLEDEHIETLRKRLPEEVIDRYHKLKQWDVPEDTYTFIFKKNLFPLLERIVNELHIDPKFVGTFLGHKMKFVEGHVAPSGTFSYEVIYDLFKFLKEENLAVELIEMIIPELYEHPMMEFESVLTTLKFKRHPKSEILNKIPFLIEKFEKIRMSDEKLHARDWIMGQLRPSAIGNIPMKELAAEVSKLL
jgi:glutamyl-tRNA(Gln) amidotransferase subunit E